MMRLSLRHGVGHRLRGTARLASTRPDAGKLPPPDLRKLAEMARIGMSEEEAQAWKPKVHEIIAWFDQLQAVDLSDVPPQLRATQSELTLREDRVESYPHVEEMMGQVPQSERGYVRVPKIGG